MVFLWFSYKFPLFSPRHPQAPAARIAQAPRSKASAKSRRATRRPPPAPAAGAGGRCAEARPWLGHGAPKNSNGTGTADLEPNAHHRIKMNQSIVGGFNESKFIKSYHGYDLYVKIAMFEKQITST